MIDYKILLMAGILLSGCSEDRQKNSIDFNNDKYEKCELLLDLKWGEPYIYDHNRKAIEIFVKTDKVYKENFQKYYFAGGAILKGDMAFAFYDKCSNKEVLLKQYIEKYLINVEGFPDYEIKPVLKGESYSTIKG